MSAPRSVADLLAAWQSGVSLTEWTALERLQTKIAAALEEARSLPPCIDRRCVAFVVTKLEEAEHWALAALRVAIDRAVRERERQAAGEGGT